MYIHVIYSLVYMYVHVICSLIYMYIHAIYSLICMSDVHLAYKYTQSLYRYGVATCNRPLKITGLFCKRAL